MATRKRSTIVHISDADRFKYHLMPRLFQKLARYEATGIIENPNEFSDLMNRYHLGWQHGGHSKSTAVNLRYERYADLIHRYPRLAVCGLSFDQLTKYNSHLRRYLAGNAAVAEKLSVPLPSENLISFDD